MGSRLAGSTHLLDAAPRRHPPSRFDSLDHPIATMQTVAARTGVAASGATVSAWSGGQAGAGCPAFRATCGSGLRSLPAPPAAPPGQRQAHPHPAPAPAPPAAPRDLHAPHREGAHWWRSTGAAQLQQAAPSPCRPGAARWGWGAARLRLATA